jgi:mono/diheme cytochrome c family protein
MMHRILALVGLVTFLIATGAAKRARAQDSQASAPQSGQVAEGKAVFQKVCTPCHGTGWGTDGAPALPGPAALALKYKGQVSPLLEQRSDLTPALVKAYVRNGTGAMPMFRKTEITDSQIEAVAAYLLESARKNPYVPPDSTNKKPEESH